MAFPNSNYSDIIATGIESRSGEIADNVSNNTALLAWLKKSGHTKTVSGGHKIIQELSFASNGNGAWYSGYDTLGVGAQDVISAAEFAWKQYAVAVSLSGLEMGQNSGKEGLIDLMDSRLDVAEATMSNAISTGIYSDGTTFGGKTITGLLAAVPVDPTTGTYGGINRANYTFWRSYAGDTNAAPSASTIQGVMNTAWANLVRGADRPNLVIMDATTWSAYVASLQTLQRFTGTDTAKLGFPTVKYMDADVVLDGTSTSVTAYLLNTKYIFFRPHKDKNMVPLSPGKRYAINQDAEVQILGWMGNLTTSNAKLQGQIVFS